MATRNSKPPVMVTLVTAPGGMLSARVVGSVLTVIFEESNSV